MLLRRLVIASLIAGAASAQAETITTPASQPSSLVSGWTTGNGTDVLGSGVLQGSLNLVAGVAHTADASLTDILYGKVAGSVQQSGGETKLFFQRGIEANYLLASGHGILAATAGLGKSVVGDAYGAIIRDGMTKAPVMTGGGSQSAGNSGAPAAGGMPGGAVATPMPAPAPDAGLGGQGSQGNDSSAGEIPVADAGDGLDLGGLNGDGIGAGAGDGLGNIADQDQQLAEVPEPSSIALMLLGMVGAGAISRRRSR